MVVNIINAIKPQVGLLGEVFWLASAIIMVLITALVCINTVDGGSVLVLAAPFLAVAGVAFAFRGSGTGFWEVEQACPVNPVSLAVARFVVVIFYDVVMITLVTIIMAMFSVDYQPGLVFISWLAPLLFLGTVTLLVAVKWNGGIAAAVGMGIWMLLVWGHAENHAFDLLALPGSEFWLTGKLLLFFLTAVGWLIYIPMMRGTFSYENLSGGEQI
jgi:hypothetical protein